MHAMVLSRRFHIGLVIVRPALHVRVCEIVGSDRLVSVPLQDRDRPWLGQIWNGKILFILFFKSVCYIFLPWIWVHFTTARFLCISRKQNNQHVDWRQRLCADLFVPEWSLSCCWRQSTLFEYFFFFDILHLGCAVMNEWALVRMRETPLKIINKASTQWVTWPAQRHSLSVLRQRISEAQPSQHYHAVSVLGGFSLFF